MKIKDTIKKPKWWDTCKKVIMQSEGHHEAIVKEHNGKMVLYCNLLDDAYFSLDEFGKGFKNAEELRLLVEQHFDYIAEDLREMIIKLVLRLRQADETIKMQDQRLEEADKLCKSFEPIAKKIEQSFNTKI